MEKKEHSLRSAKAAPPGHRPPRDGIPVPGRVAPLGTLVLVVSPDAEATRQLRDALGALGAYTSVHASAEPMRLDPARQAPGLAVVDWPGSAEALRTHCRSLREGPGGGALLVLGLVPAPAGSEAAGAPLESQALEAGCDEVLAKPLCGPLLALRLERTLARVAERQALALAERALADRRAAAPAAPAGLASSLLNAALSGSMDAVYVLRAVRGPGGSVTDFRYAEVNAPAEQMMGRTRDLLVGRTVSEIASMFRGSTLMQQCTRVFATGQALESELPMGDVERTPRWFRYQVVPYSEGVMVLSREVTERRRMEEALQRTTGQLRTLMDAIPHGLFMKDVQGRLMAVNRQMTQLMGAGHDRLLGRPTSDFGGITPRQRTQIESTDTQVLRAGRTVEFEFRRKADPGGAGEFLHVLKCPIRDSDGNIVGLVGIAQDITERKRADEEIRRGRALLQAIFDTIPHHIFVKDADDRFVAVNKAMERLQSPDDPPLAGQHVPNETHQAAPEFELSRRTTQQVLEGADRVEFSRTGNYSGVGERLYHTIKMPLKDEAGAIVGVVGISEDITDRVTAEKELRASRAVLQAVFDAIPQFVFVKDTQNRYVTVNRSMEQAYREVGPVVGRHAVNEPNRTRQELALGDATTRRVLAGEERVEYSSQASLPGGRILHFKAIKVPLKDAAGRIVGIVGVSEDMTEKIRAARRLEESQALLKAVFDAIPHTVFAKDRTSRFIAVNKAMEDQWQLPAEVLLTQRLGNDGERNAAERDMVLRQDRWVLETGQRLEERVRVTVPRKGPRDYRNIKVPLKDADGIIVGLVGVGEDITERVAAEAALQENRQLLRTILDTLPEAVYVKDRAGRYVLTNLALAEREKFPPDAMAGKTVEDLSHINPEKSRVIRDADERVMATGATVDLPEIQTVMPDGEVRWHRDVKAPLRDAEGAIVGVVGIAEDITEQRRAILAMQDSRRQLQAIVDALPETVYLKDRAGRYTLVNDTMASRLRVSKEAILNGTLEHLPAIRAESKALSAEGDRRVLETGELVELPEMELAFPDGTLIFERLLKAPLRDAAGQITGIVGIAEDITSRVFADQALKESQRLLRTIIDTLPEGIFVKDREGRYQLVNLRHAELYGLAPEAFLGRRTDELPGHVAESRVEMVRESDRRVLDQGEIVELPEVRFVPAAGDERWERLVKVPLRDEEGQIVGLVGLREDITARKKSEDERLALERLMQRTQNLESLGAMAGGIAHDFNNLLQRILGYAELATLEVEAGSPAAASVEMIHTAGVSAVELTRQMLTLSGRSRFALERVDLGELAEAGAPAARRGLPGGITLAVRRGAETPAVMADVPLLRQVLQSLINNGAEALAEQRGEIAVSTGSERLERGALDDTYSERDMESGTYGYVEVSDSGPGLTPEVRARLFEPFMTTKFMGRGLGLAAVRGIVRGHRGTIRVLSAPGAGATFRVLLPAAPEAPDAPAQ